MNKLSRSQSSIVRAVALLGLYWGCFSAPLVSKASSSETASKALQARKIDRISLALTGRLAAPEMIQAYQDKTKDLDQIVAELVANPLFIEQKSNFWLRKLQILGGPTDFQNISASGFRASLAPRVGTVDSRTLNYTAATATLPGYYRLVGRDLTAINTAANPPRVLPEAIQYDPAADQKFHQENACVVGPAGQTRHFLKAVYDPSDNFRVVTNSQVVSRNAGQTLTPAQKARLIFAVDNVEVSDLIEVTPWWNPGSQVLVCPGVATVCGSNLKECISAGPISSNGNATVTGPENIFIPRLRKAVTQEPGILIAKIVQDNRKWEEVIRSTDGVINGPMEYFYTSQFGVNILKAFPPGSYAEGSTSLLNKEANIQDENWRWIKRGHLHAGVLTTIAFQKSFNGWRAKANAAMGAFLCKEFAVPPGVRQLASDESDLSKRPYCSSCHNVLEPLSQFFGRWPNLGSQDYFYNPSAGVTANGSFNQIAGADTNGLGAIFSNTQDFKECAVKRSWEFLANREMTSLESSSYLINLTKKYDEHEGNMMKIYQEILKLDLWK